MSQDLREREMTSRATELICDFEDNDNSYYECERYSSGSNNKFVVHRA